MMWLTALAGRRPALLMSSFAAPLSGRAKHAEKSVMASSAMTRGDARLESRGAND